MNWLAKDFLYSAYLLKSYAYYKVRPHKENKSKENEINNIIVVYSKIHFDPKVNNERRALSSSSAGNLARNIYTNLSNRKPTIYVDGTEALKEIPKADLVIGVMSPNFIKILNANKTAQKILFLVNCHPLYRDKVLLKESFALKKIVTGYEWVDPLDFLKVEKTIDKFILIGNDFTKETYLDKGINKRKLFLINSGVNLDILKPDKNKLPKASFRIVAVASHLAIRKGLFRIINMWKSIDLKTSKKLELIIVGNCDPFKKEVLEFAKTVPGVTYMGWIDSSTEEYKKILQSSHVVLSFSLEEGQLGCGLEAMACGCVPFLTKQSGIGITDGEEGFLIKDITSPQETIDKIAILLNNPKKFEEMSKKSRQFVEKHHTWAQFNKDIQKIVLN